MTIDKDFKVNTSTLNSYDNIVEKQCWFDECSCEDIPIADCDGLIEENNKGVGRFACMMKEQKCYNTQFFGSFMKKLACQLDRYIMNICALWDMIECIRDFIIVLWGELTKTTKVVDIYTRHSGIASSTYYHPITDTYDINLYMNSTTGHVQGENDDGKRQLTDMKYKAFVRWCGDGTGMSPTENNIVVFTVYHSGETFSEAMETERSVHWQIQGVPELAAEMSDTIILPKGTHLKVRVSGKEGTTGTFRAHNFRVEYTPMFDIPTLPECMQDRA